MDIPLQSPRPAVNMLEGHVSQHETVLTLYCHDGTFRNATVSEAVGGKPVFRVEGARFGTSWSWRRKVFSSTSTSTSSAAGDEHLFDFRHENLDLKNRWVVEDAAGRKLVSIVHKSQVTSDHSAVDATVRTVVGEDVPVFMRPRDGGALTVTINVGETAIATIRKAVDNTKTMDGNRDRSVWEIRVAAGVDLSMIVAMALCRAEMGHVWKQ